MQTIGLEHQIFGKMWGAILMLAACLLFPIAIRVVIHKTLLEPWFQEVLAERSR